MTNDIFSNAVISSENIFEDLGFGMEEALNLNVRADLMLELRAYIQNYGWPQ